jgi:DNA helicase-2/ATP-dependent DNA helicase PcrA
LGLPYRVVGGPRFYERREIRDALAYFRVLHSNDDDLAFERIFNLPKRGLGDASLRLLQGLRRARGLSLFEAARQVAGTDELRPQARRALGDLVRAFDGWRELAADMPHPELAEVVLDESGYTDMWRNDKSIEAPGRLENLKELIEALREFDTLAGFLEHVSLVMENLEDSSRDQVTIMTLHAAKGLEFETVFLPGWEEGLFPNQRALDQTGMKGLEEERRLAYVGLTRAKTRAVVSFAANRRLHGSWAAAIPSRFVDELPEDHVEQESDQGLYGASAQTWGGGFGGFQDWGDTRNSPGMLRARARERTDAPLIEGSATLVHDLPAGRFGAGGRVFHQKFGYGTVSFVEGERLTIAFDKAGEKKVMASFVMPAEEAG